jgi:CDP-4-dehydro-6-deoxyglucose reductase, E1
LVSRSLELDRVARSMTLWGRDLEIGDAFLDRYTYATIGTDCQMSAIQAAFGLAQIDKVEAAVAGRAEQFEEMTALFGAYGGFDLPLSPPAARPSWFAYPLVVRDDAGFDRRELAEYLQANHVEIRPIMCGNILQQRPYRSIQCVRLDDTFPIGDRIERAGLFLPCWGMPAEQRDHYYGILRRFLETRRPAPR